VNKTLAVIRRELVARVRTRAFLISTLILPILMVFVAVVPALMMRGGNRTMRIAVVDGTTDSLGSHIESALAGERVSRDPAALPRYTLQRFAGVGRVAALRDSLVAFTGVKRDRYPESYDGVLVITDSTLISGKADYLGTNTSSLESMGQLEGTISKVLAQTRLAQSGLDPELVASAIRPANLNATKVSDGKATGQSGIASFAIAYFMAFLLYLSVVLYGQQTMTSVIEEKTSRIMEVLASSMRPFQMLLGKVLGVGLTGLLQMAIWGGTYYLVTSQRGLLAGMFGMSADAMQALPIPVMPTDLLIVFLLYFMLGFLLFGALYAAIGSICNTVQETQQYAVAVTMVLMLGFFSAFAVMKDPTGGLAVTLSFVPFVSQLVMPVRWSLAAVSPVELAGSLALGIAALLGVTWLAGRIYRTGILMYGKKPTFGEVFRWIRQG
jgi:ABC-2 type transport system permease protein